MIGVDPLRRVWLQILGRRDQPTNMSLIFVSVGCLGGALVGVSWLGVDSGSFWANMRASVDFLMMCSTV